LALLCDAERHDAVVAYVAAIAYAHRHDTDGTLDTGEQAAIARQANVQPDVWDVLRSYGLVTRRPRSRRGDAVVIAAYTKWQTTRSEREEHAHVMRDLRSRDDGETNHVMTSQRRRDSKSREEKSREEKKKTSLSSSRDAIQEVVADLGARFTRPEETT